MPVTNMLLNIHAWFSALCESRETWDCHGNVCVVDCHGIFFDIKGKSNVCILY